jgi:hypothetical protein
MLNGRILSEEDFSDQVLSLSMVSFSASLPETLTDCSSGKQDHETELDEMEL